jgi:hypothetical protein
MGKLALAERRQRQRHRAAASDAESYLRAMPAEIVRQLSPHARAVISNARRELRGHGRSDRSTDADGAYNMVFRVKAKQVFDRIRALPPDKRPVQVRDAFILVLLSVDKNTPVLPYTRDGLAEEIGCLPRHVSSIMGTLEELGVLTRERRPSDGVRGRGRVVYVVEVTVAWNGDLEFRQRVTAEQRQRRAERNRAKLKLVQPPEAAE